MAAQTTAAIAEEKLIQELMDRRMRGCQREVGGGKVDEPPMRMAQPIPFGGHLSLEAA